MWRAWGFRGFRRFWVGVWGVLDFVSISRVSGAGFLFDAVTAQCARLVLDSQPEACQLEFLRPLAILYSVKIGH